MSAESRIDRPTILVRDASETDADAVMRIYNHEVLHGTATLDIEPRNAASNRAWMDAHRGAHPLLIAELAGAVVGFACLSPFRTRAAYTTTVENSIYVAPGAQGRGVGNALMAALIERARHHGYHSMIARIAGENPASVGLHERHGFKLVGVEREIGRKFGAWLDVTEMQLLL